MTVYANAEDWSDDPADQLMQFSHGVTDINANGSVFFKLQAASNFVVDAVVLDAAGRKGE